ncbi:hypothetical protein PENTCL1PPCAC_6584 [Pristionchus entomophagus]|uniref:Uncharacterized protein n=1 Tax=Pristionchus entomophagus TaxID=358040 RepID=A0AAV5SNB4_9BILA|nr:hypothetical protein PENTCL1PPCAC_6584 [Pristionchus entomophagus]
MERKEEEETEEKREDQTGETEEPRAKKGKITVEEVSEEGPTVSSPQMITYDPSSMTIDRETLPSILGITGNPTGVLLQMHGISVNPPERFILSPHPLENAIKKAMHDSYWKLLSEDLEKSPPVYKTAIALVNEIKEMLLNGLIPMRDEKRRNEVAARLDINTLQNEVEQGEMNVATIASFILNVFTSICAPHRDPEIKQIKENMHNLPILLRNLMEMTDKIKEDVVSFKLEMRRDEVIEAARMYEKHDLESSFTVVKGAKEKLEGWIRNVYEKTAEEGDSMDKVKEIVRRVVRRGFIQNLSASSISDIPFHWRLDLKEIQHFSLERRRIALIAASVYLLNSIHPLHSQSQSSLIPRLVSLSHHLSKDNINDILDSVYMECEKVLREANTLNEETEDKVKVIRALSNKDQPLRVLAEKRLDEYMFTLVNSPSVSPLPLPPSPLTPLSSLFLPLQSNFLRYIIHNENTFYDLYVNVISKVLTLRQE